MPSYIYRQFLDFSKIRLRALSADNNLHSERAVINLLGIGL